MWLMAVGLSVSVPTVGLAGCVRPVWAVRMTRVLTGESAAPITPVNALLASQVRTG